MRCFSSVGLICGKPFGDEQDSWLSLLSSDAKMPSGDAKNAEQRYSPRNGTKVTASSRFWGYNCFMGIGCTPWFRPRTPAQSLACWVDFLVCPRRYLAVL